VVGPTQGPGLYILGLAIVALYAPLYWWRAWQDRRLAAGGSAGGLAGVTAPAPAAALVGDGGPEPELVVESTADPEPSDESPSVS
jgi:hypothetical protein